MLFFPFCSVISHVIMTFISITYQKEFLTIWTLHSADISYTRLPKNTFSHANDTYTYRLLGAGIPKLV